MSAVKRNPDISDQPIGKSFCLFFRRLRFWVVLGVVERKPIHIVDSLTLSCNIFCCCSLCKSKCKGKVSFLDELFVAVEKCLDKSKKLFFFLCDLVSKQPHQNDVGVKLVAAYSPVEPLDPLNLNTWVEIFVGCANLADGREKMERCRDKIAWFRFAVVQGRRLETCKQSLINEVLVGKEKLCQLCDELCLGDRHAGSQSFGQLVERVSHVKNMFSFVEHGFGPGIGFLSSVIGCAGVGALGGKTLGGMA